MKAAIWANSREIGDKQLLKIEKQYNFSHIKTKRKVISKSSSWIEFENGDFWRVCTNIRERGYKFNIAYIQRNFPKEAINNIIKPSMVPFPYQAFNYFQGDED